MHASLPQHAAPHRHSWTHAPARVVGRAGVVLGLALAVAACADAGPDPLAPDAAMARTQVPGHQHARYDRDGNGFPDAGVYVNGHYRSTYAYDAAGDWYWDLGDGRVQGTVGGVDALDTATLTVCDYVNNYRADFGNDPYMNAGWVQNHIRCHGYDDNNHYNYLIVHSTDPRYTGNPDWAIWGDWEYHALTMSHVGNLVGPYNHAGG